MSELVIRLWKNKFRVSEIAFLTNLSCKEVITIITDKQVIDYINESYH